MNKKEPNTIISVVLIFSLTFAYLTLTTDFLDVTHANKLPVPIITERAFSIMRFLN